MALKAGRVGLNKDLVDEFGYLKGEAPSGEYYTKTQTDNKFETKTHVNNTFQKKTLEVPIDLLSGSALTVESALQGINEEKFNRAEQNVLGAKNILPNNAANQTINGLTFTVNADGSVTVNGTATANTSFYVLNRKTWDCNNDTIFNGCPVNGSDNSFRCQVYDYTTSQSYIDYGIGVNLPKSVYGNSIDVFIRVANGYTADNITFYPMIRLASDIDNTYVPYAMTNKKLTDMMLVRESACTDIISGASVSENRNYLFKCGKVVQLLLQLSNVTVTTAWTDIVCKIPEGYRPKVEFRDLDALSNSRFRVQPNGELNLGSTVSESGVLISVTWITS